MGIKKISLSEIRGTLSKSEMKKIMAGSHCNGLCDNGDCRACNNYWCCGSNCWPCNPDPIDNPWL